MLRARHTMLILLPAIFVGYAACGGEDASEETTVEENTVEEVGAVEATTRTEPILGTFRDEQAHYGIAVLTLKRDATYHLEEGVECVKAPCIRPEMNGIYKVGMMNGSAVLMLMDRNSTAAPPTYLKYMVREDVLYVAPFARNATWQALKRTEDQAWCAVPNDCALQNLQTGPCAGQWSCPANVCQYACGRVSCETDNSCSDM